MDAYRSQDTVIYRPIGDDAPEAVALCSYGDVMPSLVTVVPSVQVQREAVIGSRWMHQAARGNAGLQRSFSLARAFSTYAAARAWGSASTSAPGQEKDREYRRIWTSGKAAACRSSFSCRTISWM